MKYLLDTCVLSEMIRLNPNASVIKWISSCNEDQLFISVLTLGEIQKGISKLSNIKRKDVLQHWLDNDLTERFDGRILPITRETALTWGEVLGEAEAKGRTLPSIDGLIGATAIAHNLTVVTRNEKDLTFSGVKLLNPWTI